MFNLVIDLLKELEWRDTDHTCKLCSGMKPNEYDHMAPRYLNLTGVASARRRGHYPNCKLRFVLKELEDMQDYL